MNRFLAFLALMAMLAGIAWQYHRSEWKTVALAGADTRPLLIYQRTRAAPDGVSRHDCMSVASEDGVRDAERGGYELARVSGWVFAYPQTGREPLKLFYNPVTGDHFTTGTAAGEQTALQNGYVFARIEGYVLPAREQVPANAVPINSYWSPTVFDHCTLASAQAENDARAAGYLFVRTEGYGLTSMAP